MAQILPYQRQVGDAPGLGFQASPNGGDPISQGLASVGQGLGNFEGALREREQKMQTAQTTLTAATLTNDLRDAHDSVAQGVQSGDIPSDKAIQTFRDQASALRDKALDGLTPIQQQQISSHFITSSGDLARNLNVAVFQRNQSEAAATIDNYIEQAQRSAKLIGPEAAAGNVKDFVGFAGPQAGLSPEKQAKIIQSATEGLYFNAFQSHGVDALTKGDAEGVAEVRKQLMSSDGDPLDPQKRTILNHQLYGYEQHILAERARAANAVDAEQDRKEKAAADIYNQALDLTISGGTMEPSFIKEFSEKTAGTSAANDAIELMKGQTVVSGFATKTAAQRTGIVESMRSDAVVGGTSPDRDKLIKSLSVVNDRITTEQKENPWAAAQKSGVIADAKAFDAAKPDSAFAIVAERNKDIAKVEQWTGSKVSPFQPQEITQLAKSVRSLPPEQAAPYLGKLGETIGDVDRINMVATELDKSDKPLALALKLGTDRTTAGRAVSELLLKGAQGIKDKVVKADDTKQAGWRAEIAGKVRGTMGDPQMEEDIIDSAYYTRAGLELTGQEIPGFKAADATNDKAIQMVIGTPMERAGVKTILPRGFDENMFDQKLRSLKVDDLRALSPTFYSRGRPITPEQLTNRLSEFGMRRDGTGRYIPVNNGAPVTTDEAGTNPLRIRVQ